MKKAIEVADTTFGAYKKRDGSVALHLITYLIVYANADFRTQIRKATPSLNLDEPMKPAGLGTFMKECPRCWLQLPGRKPQNCELSYACYPATRSILRPSGAHWFTYEPQDITDGESILFSFWATMIVRDEDIFGGLNVRGLTIANMKVAFDINFPGRPPGEKIIMRKKAPVVRRGPGW